MPRDTDQFIPEVPEGWAIVHSGQLGYLAVNSTREDIDYGLWYPGLIDRASGIILRRNRIQETDWLRMAMFSEDTVGEQICFHSTPDRPYFIIKRL